MVKLISKFLAASAATCLASAAWSVVSPPFGLEDPVIADRYQKCLERAQKEAAEAYEDAMAWKAEGGGGASEHCAAVALIGVKQYGEAAQRLDRLARKSSAGGEDTRAQLLGQAGNAWLLAGEANLARQSFAAALTLAPGDRDLLIDRARASAILNLWPAAEQDLGAALKADPSAIDAMVLRASARRAQGNVKGAEGDVTKALLIDPNNVEALVEYGLLRLISRDIASARGAFLGVLAKAPDSPAAETARREIAKLDVKDLKPKAAPAAPAQAPQTRPTFTTGSGQVLRPAQ